MEAIFIRHNMGEDEKTQKETLQKMWNDRVIVLDYEKKRSIDPDDYKYENSKKAIRKLVNYCDKGVLVGADYRRLHKDRMLIGEIPPGTPIEYRTYDGYEYYKAVTLSKAMEVSFIEYPVLMTIQPRQAAITGWPSAKKILDALVNGKKIPFEVNSLSLEQLEVLCYEYLKINRMIRHLLLPIGRTLRDIDIFGIDENERKVFAQVTFSKNPLEIKGKAERLNEFKNSNQLYFFCPQGSIIIDFPNIKYISIEDAFNSFIGSHLLKNMLPL